MFWFFFFSDSSFYTFFSTFKRFLVSQCFLFVLWHFQFATFIGYSNFFFAIYSHFQYCFNIVSIQFGIKLAILAFSLLCTTIVCVCVLWFLSPANFGGIIGLFLGASLMSGVELFYYFTVGLYTHLRQRYISTGVNFSLNSNTIVASLNHKNMIRKRKQLLENNKRKPKVHLRHWILSL